MTSRILVVRCLMLLVGAAPPWAAAAEPVPAGQGDPGDSACLSCHADRELHLKLESGETRSLQVSGEDLARSVHAKLRCTDCHAGMEDVPHPERHYKNASQFKAGFRDVCKS
ncbi:MAG TPA: hypothetical protein VJU18_06890, partial [Vicinamibacteria bacterium]|nr:hypothetical protein [Vicinamibacteria bacterium]